ncbi:MAG TPA: hypothetical protein VF595_17260, partial [Tepidisphaeraceae bacterium]
MARISKAVAQAVRPVVEQLEIRRLLTTVTLTADGSEDNVGYVAVLNAGTNNIDFSVNGVLTQSVPATQLSRVVIVDTGTGTDDLYINTPGIAFALEANVPNGLWVHANKGGITIDSSQTLFAVEIEAGASMNMVGAGTALTANSVSVAGQFQHSAGLLKTSSLQIAQSGSFLDAGGSIGHASGVTINNVGTFKAAFAGSLAGTTGTFYNAGHFISDVGSGQTATVSMSFVNYGMSFNLVSGTLRLLSSFDTWSDLSIDGTAGTLRVPSYNNTAGQITQTGGTFTVDTEFWHGDHYASGASYTLTGGRFNAATFAVGCFSNNVVFNQSGGSLHISGDAIVGMIANNAVWNQTGGANVINNLVLGSWAGTGGTVNLSGGSITANQANIGFGGTPGTFNLSGTGVLTVQTERVGSWSGTGVFNQTGGTHNVAELRIGDVLDGNGTYNLSGGTLNSETQFIAVASYQQGLVRGTFRQTGGANNVSNEIIMAYRGSAIANYEMSGGTLNVPRLGVGQGQQATFTQTAGQTVISNALVVGDVNGQSGAFNLSGGSVSVGATAFIGHASNGTMNHSGGSLVVAENLYVAGSGRYGPNPLADATYNLSGSGQVSASNLYVGYSGNGEFNQTGGSLSLNGYIALNGPSGTTGEFNRTGGTYNNKPIINVVTPSINGLALVDEGSSYRLNLSASSGVGAFDVNRWHIGWGDQSNEVVYWNAPYADHTYMVGGNIYTINAAASGGGMSNPAPPVQVAVAAVPATTQPIADKTVVAGEDLTVTIPFTYPGLTRSHTVRIDWGDGVIETSGIGSNISVQEEDTENTGTISARHIYQTGGRYDAVVTIIDDRGVSSSQAMRVEASYVAPDFSLSFAPTTLIEGQTATLKMTASGPGAIGVTAWKVDWGDGNIITYPGRTATADASEARSTVFHAYKAAGSYRIRAWAYDSGPTAHAVGTVTATVTPPIERTGGAGLSIRTASTGAVGSVLLLQAVRGMESASTVSPDYVWTITRDGATVATGTGMDFRFVPEAAGTYVAQVTEIGDPAGPFVADQTIEVTVPEGAILPFEGPPSLEVGHIASFNFNQSTLWEHFGKEQVDAWKAEAVARKSSAGPIFTWTVHGSGTAALKTVQGPMIYGSDDSLKNFVSPTLMFAAPQIGAYTFALTISYNGKTYFQNTLVLSAVAASVAQVVSNGISNGIQWGGMKGDSAVENADGSIMVVNQAHGAYPFSAWWVTKFNSDLTLDTTFQSYGRVEGPRLDPILPYSLNSTGHSYWNGKGVQIALQRDGKLVVATSVLGSFGAERHAYHNHGEGHQLTQWHQSAQIIFLIARYNPDGTLDTTFGEIDPAGNGLTRTGLVIDSDPKNNDIQSLVIQEDGKIVIAGSGFTPLASGQPLYPAAMGYTQGPTNRPAFLVRRYGSDGSLDGDFGNSGSSFIPVSPDQDFTGYDATGPEGPGDSNPARPLLGSESAMSVVVDRDGKLVVGGFTSRTYDALEYDEYHTTSISSKFALIRLTANGGLDTSFGTQGKATTSFQSKGKISAVIRDLGIDGSGNIIAMGSAGSSEFQHDLGAEASFAIAKYDKYG